MMMWITLRGSGPATVLDSASGTISLLLLWQLEQTRTKVASPRASGVSAGVAAAAAGVAGNSRSAAKAFAFSALSAGCSPMKERR